VKPKNKTLVFLGVDAAMKKIIQQQIFSFVEKIGQINKTFGRK
jgi:hypothetical protein